MFTQCKKKTSMSCKFNLNICGNMCNKNIVETKTGGYKTIVSSKRIKNVEIIGTKKRGAVVAIFVSEYTRYQLKYKLSIKNIQMIM